MNGRRGGQVPWMPILLLVAFFALTSARQAAAWVLDIEWWKEVGQIDTYWLTIWYGVVPGLIVALLGFVVLWMAHARALKKAGTGLGRVPLYAKVSTLAILVLAWMASGVTVDNWTAVRFMGSRRLGTQAGSWVDPVFGHPLSFYLFELPFWNMLLDTALLFTVLTGVLYAAATLYWSLRERMPRLLSEGTFEISDLDLESLLTSKFVRLIAMGFLLALAANHFLGRYDLLTEDHGFMVGMDYTDERVRLPLRWLTIAACLGGALLVWMQRWGVMAAVVVVCLIVESVAPRVVHSIYVRPNEISLEKPYIERHIQATRTAYLLDRRAKEVEFPARLSAPVNINKHQELFDNVRLWDWRAFHDTVSQIQALRPYYVFHDTDVDRYMLDGRLRQVMLTPRELDVRQLSPDARGRWMNPHFIYTHGYGLVLAEANRITADGLPMLFIQNAPPEVRTKSLQLTRPEIYYGETVHEPVFVRTGQPEFNYPSGAENVHSRYEGTGGFPISSVGMRLAATVARADWNIFLTGFLQPESRMMIRRDVRERVSELAGFLRWDSDPYLVITKAGRLVWMIDGYTTSRAHPYSQLVRLPESGAVNYVRNAVKATVDAYDGDVQFYVFDAEDPIIRAYGALFPKLLQPASAMPADLREHARYPEQMFRIQAEIYRNFHMLDPESFYNKEDAWDIARFITADGKPSALAPTYVVATLPGESKPEFLLMTHFTPRNKDNLIGTMVARCDGEKLGEMHFLQLSKQELIFGPLQIEARINQDQNISKDLSLWNQQGSQVLRGQMLVLPVDNAFVYIEPIYIQAREARMPQLKKVAIAAGNSLFYADTYEQALAQLAGMQPAAAPAPAGGTPAPPPQVTSGTTPPPVPTGPSDADRRLDEARRRMQRYKDLAAQGKWAEAGQELEALEAIVRK
ncbi:MAG: UPF0182 family protein [Bryobacterales bacterium]|nr:UPF0182 family protein [Bryobacterales bacterium]